jgi:hypothetical protein
MRYEELATQIGIVPKDKIFESWKLPPVNSAKMQALREAAGSMKVEDYLKSTDDAKAST